MVPPHRLHPKVRKEHGVDPKQIQSDPSLINGKPQAFVGDLWLRTLQETKLFSIAVSMISLFNFLCQLIRFLEQQQQRSQAPKAASQSHVPQANMSYPPTDRVQSAPPTPFNNASIVFPRSLDALQQDTIPSALTFATVVSWLKEPNPSRQEGPVVYEITEECCIKIILSKMAHAAQNDFTTQQCSYLNIVQAYLPKVHLVINSITYVRRATLTCSFSAYLHTS